MNIRMNTNIPISTNMIAAVPAAAANIGNRHIITMNTAAPAAVQTTPTIMTTVNAVIITTTTSTTAAGVDAITTIITKRAELTLSAWVSVPSD